MRRFHLGLVAGAGLALLGAAVWTTRFQPPSVRPGASVAEPDPHGAEGMVLAADSRGSDVHVPAATAVAPARVDPELSAAVEEFTRVDDELSARLDVPPSWNASTSPPPFPGATLPTFPLATTPAAQLAEASRWFDGLPKDGHTTQAELNAKRARMSKAGLDLLQSECRAGVCRLSFAYSAFSSERLIRRMGGRDSARSRPNWWSFTIIKPDGRVEGHVFMAGGANRGGAK